MNSKRRKTEAAGAGSGSTPKSGKTPKANNKGGTGSGLYGEPHPHDDVLRDTRDKLIALIEEQL